LSLSATRLCENQELTVRSTVTNASARATDETVQCYVIPPRDQPETPRATLVDFRKIPVPANATVEIEFKLTGEAFRQVNQAGERVWSPGRYGLVVGPASPGPRAIALGAPAPATGEIILG
jgi:beta-glucosidase